MGQPIIFEMETSDPDDFLTLLWLADHPDLDLIAVLVTPGGEDQCRLVRWALDQCDRPLTPIGMAREAGFWRSAAGQASRVSEFHYKVYGEEPRHYANLGAVGHGPTMLAHYAKVLPDLTVLVGSAPKNIGAAFELDPTLRLARWIQQGGFAGASVVEPKHQLEKFRGVETCPSYNPGGAPRQTLALLGHPGIQDRIFVSKNVCHGVTWTAELQVTLVALQPFGATMRPGLKMMIYGLACYLRDKGVGKAMHDLVAAAVALDERVCELKPVEVYREGGRWGAKLAAQPNARISVAISLSRFVTALAR